MRRFRIRTDLERADLDGFRLPLGLVPDGAEAPAQGYTVDFVPSEGEDIDVYSFHAVVSHERVAPLVRRFFGLLPDEVTPILEVGSRDAYRSVDVYLGSGPLPRAEFLRAWKHFESFILEDGSITVGANAEEPFVEVCLDHAKGIAVHVTPSMRDAIDAMMRDEGLDEVPVTWPRGDEEDQEFDQGLKARSVLQIVDEFSPDLDELILQMRVAWELELDVDPDSNLDEAGRELGHTLWHAMAIVEDEGDPDHGAYASVWATASSLHDMEHLIAHALEEGGRWNLTDIFTIDRIAYDERPDELVDLAPRTLVSRVHLVQFDEWSAPPDVEDPDGDAADDPADTDDSGDG